MTQQRRRILFVCRAESSESSRAAQALASLDNVEVLTTDPEKLNDEHGPLDMIEILTRVGKGRKATEVD